VSVPKIITNNTISLSFKTAISISVISNHNCFRVLYDKTAFVYYFIWKKYINISALEMASPENWHCANCIGTLLFPIDSRFSRTNPVNFCSVSIMQISMSQQQRRVILLLIMTRLNTYGRRLRPFYKKPSSFTYLFYCHISASLVTSVQEYIC